MKGDSAFDLESQSGRQALSVIAPWIARYGTAVRLPTGPGRELTAPEQRLVKCVAAGETWKPDLPDAKLKFDRFNPDAWPEECIIGADVVVCLATSSPWKEGEKAWPVHPNGINIEWARIKEIVNLSYCEVHFPLSLQCCAIQSRFDLFAAKTRDIYLDGSYVGMLDAERARIEGNLHLREFASNDESQPSLTFRSFVQVSLVDAIIAGQLDCLGGEFFWRADAPEGNTGALSADGVKVGAHVRLNRAWIKGGADFRYAHVSGDFIADNAEFSAPDQPDPKEKSAGQPLPYETGLSLSGATIENELRLKFIRSFDGELDLSFAKARIYLDDGSVWRKPNPMEQLAAKAPSAIDGKKRRTATAVTLDGFEYARFGHRDGGGFDVLKWLRSQPERHLGKHFRPQPWQQAISVLKAMGDESNARLVAMKRELQLRRAGQLGPIGWSLNALRAITVGHGYRPALALAWSVFFVLAGAAIFDLGGEEGYFAPGDTALLASTEWQKSCSMPTGYPNFNALMYAVDTYVPFVDFHLKTSWSPSSVARACARMSFEPVPLAGVLSPQAEKSITALTRPAFSAGALTFSRWLLTALGWIFVPLFLIGVSGIMKKE